MTFPSLTAYQADALTEVVNVSMGTSVSELSELFNCHVSMTPPTLNVAKVTDIFSYIGDPDEETYTILSRFFGEMNGNFIFLFRPTKQDEQWRRFLQGQDALHTLKQIADTVCQAFTASFAAFTNLTVQKDHSQAAFDLLGAIVEYGFMEHTLLSDDLLFSQGTFSLNDFSLTGNLLFFPSPESLSLLFEKLGVNDDNH